jgi:hypothetical protein
MNRICRINAIVSLTALFAAASPAPAGIFEVMVGVTPSCPEGFMGCWGESVQALRALEGVQSVAANPDLYNATASVHLKAERLPDVAKWREQFQQAFGGRIAFRGVEVTVEGTLKSEGGTWWLELPESPKPLRLAALENKLQWNHKKKSARGPEEEERRAYADLSAKAAKAKGPLMLRITGPLRPMDGVTILEVREFFLVEPEKAE